METLQFSILYSFLPRLKTTQMQQHLKNRQTVTNVVKNVNHLLKHPVVLQNFAFNALFVSSTKYQPT